MIHRNHFKDIAQTRCLSNILELNRQVPRGIGRVNLVTEFRQTKWIGFTFGYKSDILKLQICSNLIMTFSIQALFFKSTLPSMKRYSKKY